MILDKEAREAFNNEDWEIVKEYIEYLERGKDRLDRMETILNTMEKDKDAEPILTKYFAEFKA